MIYKSRYLDIVLIIIFIYSVFFIVHKFLGGKVPFWDFHIIYCQSKTFFLGNIPYGSNVHGDCLDPRITLIANFLPSTLEILKYIGSINIKTANFFWVFLEIISFFLIFVVLKETFKFNYEWRNFLLIFVSFGSTIFFSFISGNISVILYGFLALGIFFLQKKLFNYYEWETGVSKSNINLIVSLLSRLNKQFQLNNNSKVFEIARKNNTKIPVWIDGSIQFKIPQKITKQSVAPDVQVTLS